MVQIFNSRGKNQHLGLGKVHFKKIMLRLCVIYDVKFGEVIYSIRQIV